MASLDGAEVGIRKDGGLPDEGLPDDVHPDDVHPDDVHPDDVHPDDVHPDEGLPELVEYFGSSLSETKPSEDESSEDESSENKPKDELIRMFKPGRKRGLMVSFVPSFRDARRLLGKNNLAFTKQDFGDCLGPFNWREYVVGWDGYGTVMFEANDETAALITIAPPDAGFTVYRGDETELIIVANGDVKTVVMVLEGRWALKIKSAAKT